jgi:hypothetical protein
VLSGASPVRRTLFWAGMVVVVLHPALFWAVGLVTALDSVVDLSARVAASPGPLNLARQQLAFLLSGLQRRLFWYTVPGFVLFGIGSWVAVHNWDEVAAPAATPAASAASGRTGMVTVTTSEGSFAIDPYEFPNEVGALPTTALAPKQADLACRKLGKRLCDARQWYLACSAGGANRFVLRGERRNLAALGRVRAACNFHGPARAARLAPSGVMPDCRNTLGLFDMAGNAFEWVRLAGTDGLWGLAGSYYGYGDDQTLECGFFMLLHEAQLRAVDAAAIGFRCCGEREWGASARRSDTAQGPRSRTW